jgi:hypothetical protein
MAWKNHEDETLITDEKHDSLSAQEKIKYYKISQEEEVVTSTPKQEENGEGQELDPESSES